MLSSRLPDLRALELLAAIARTRSITLAAGELQTTQQAASGRLRRLENSLGRVLVTRSSRSSELTADGAALLSLAAPVLHAASALDAGIGGLFTTDAVVTVASSLTVAEFFLPRWIAAYAASGNDARRVASVATNTREVVRLVSDAQADLGFVEAEAPPPGLRYRPLAADELGVYVAPGHPWARGERVSAWTLAKAPLVTREAGSGCRAVMAAALTAHGVERSELAEPALELPSNTAVLEAAAANVAPAVISTLPAEKYVRDGRLVRVGVTRVEFVRQLGAVWRHGAEPASHGARQLLRAASAGVPALLPTRPIG
ncbi:LysR family transcriptional regulator [Galbitalea sp. SE-J8]|uniref:LysR family transcriptional regulator n=1 Tax=Galbitalea sp. SE-J8 TaxID=3054952 RepID=UPI00259CD7D3|nr:LysR family transcriptional regulator [Galbitalea sp. SE-J8]MDM4763017.1 LysR family transcriptional regulator [Galbitalea sp. SE-J8]